MFAPGMQAGSELFDVYGLHIRCAGVSLIPRVNPNEMKPRLSLRQWLAAHQHALHRAAVRTGHRAVSGEQADRPENWPNFQSLPRTQLDQQNDSTCMDTSSFMASNTVHSLRTAMYKFEELSC